MCLLFFYLFRCHVSCVLEYSTYTYLWVGRGFSGGLGLVNTNYFIYRFIYFNFYGHIQGIQKFPGQILNQIWGNAGSTPYCARDLTCTSAVARAAIVGFLTHCATAGTLQTITFRMDNQLYSTGNYIQSAGIEHDGK